MSPELCSFDILANQHMQIFELRVYVLPNSYIELLISSVMVPRVGIFGKWLSLG
jgi:hypothetical protein